MNLLTYLQRTFLDALTGLTDEPARFAVMVRPTNDPRFNADYQANCAMPLAKATGRKPHDVAKDVIARLPSDGSLEPAEVAGPGFINLRLNADWLSGHLQTMAADPRLGVARAVKPLTVVIDYSGPNVAKPLHVGHLRSTIIGDALARLFRFLGHTVISDNHLGDWGTQFGMLIHGYKHFRDDAALAKDPVAEMVRLYQKVRQLTKGTEDDEGEVTLTSEEAAHLEACRLETARLHAGDPENRALWNKFMPWCMGAIEPIYERLGVKFDHILGESFYNPMLPEVTKSLLERGVAYESNGAVLVGPEKSPSIVRKRDGAYSYTATDLATIRYRMEQFHPDQIVYVVDFRQTHHFKNLFTAAKAWGYDQVHLEHVSFGSVLGNDGKPLSTRNGGATELGDLLSMACARGREKYDEIRAERVARGEEVPELSEEQQQEIAVVVGTGAVKYADLAQHRTSDYKFEWKKMLATDGNTATYMQYAFVRCYGIFRKGGIDPEQLRQNLPTISLAHPAERSLGLQLLRFEETLESAAAEYAPHLLTSYLWDLAKAYTSFFEKCPVLKAETRHLTASRLVLCDLTARVIRVTLDLLGIRTVERM